jgi:hypothetical protein
MARGAHIKQVVIDEYMLVYVCDNQCPVST